MDKPILMQFQDLPFNGDTVIQDEFLKLKKDFNLTTAIETGSCFFSTTKWLSEKFESVYTCEINQEFAKFELENILKKENVFYKNQDSVEFLREILSGIVSEDERCIFFLDAHWNQFCPLLSELLEIANIKTKQPPIITIHDFKTNNEELGYDSYNGQDFTIDWIKPYIEIIENKLMTPYSFYYNEKAEGAKRGIIYLIPKI